MPNPDFVRTMARYNAWQNDSLVAAAEGLSDADRRLERGAFFGSIHRTFSHVLWGDQIWMSRFTSSEPPSGNLSESPDHFPDWEAFKQARTGFDRRILDWALAVEPVWFEGDLSWFSPAVGRDVTKPKAMLAVHFFNHQTDHRGQIHAMLTAAGAAPDDTDIPFMPERYQDL